MFLGISFNLVKNAQQAALLLNTVLLIAALIVAELVFAEAPLKTRKELRYFYPLIVMLAGVLLYAAYKQGTRA